MLNKVRPCGSGAVNCSFKRHAVDTWITSWSSVSSFSSWWPQLWLKLKFIVQQSSDRDYYCSNSAPTLLRCTPGAAGMPVRMGCSSAALVCLGVCVFLASRGLAGCRDERLCCSGREPSCVSAGWKSDRSYGSCYCDQVCVSTLDCCHDYQTACPGGFLLKSHLNHALHHGGVEALGLWIGFTEIKIKLYKNLLHSIMYIYTVKYTK